MTNRLSHKAPVVAGKLPRVEFLATDTGATCVRLSGCWTLAWLGPSLKELNRQLAKQVSVSGGAGKHKAADLIWDCEAIELMDSTGAFLLWRCWGRDWPANLRASEEQRRIWERIARLGTVEQAVSGRHAGWNPVRHLGGMTLNFLDHLQDFIRLIGQLSLDSLHSLRHPREIPWLEISANLYKSGVRAMPVNALVGFLIGIVMSYLSALQLRQFGGEVFIVNILGMSIIRELGPVLVAVLVAGRSGSAMTAQLGVMRVTEEIDALSTMGISHSLRLIFPKVCALSLVMPLLVLWHSAVALFGGMIAAQLQLDISYGYFIENLPKVVPIANLWIGLFKGYVFGMMVALIACHFGLRVKPNTESLSSNTTSSVVTAITLVILIDAIIAILTRGIGLFGA